MACIYKEIIIKTPQLKVWDAVKDVGSVHARLARGFVVDTRLEGESRVVTFANGLVVRESILDINEALCRLSYAAVNGRASHHNASMQVFAEDQNTSRLLWITDFKPDELMADITRMVEMGSAAMRRTLEQ